LVSRNFAIFFQRASYLKGKSPKDRKYFSRKKSLQNVKKTKKNKQTDYKNVKIT